MWHVTQQCHDSMHLHIATPPRLRRRAAVLAAFTVNEPVQQWFRLRPSARKPVMSKEPEPQYGSPPSGPEVPQSERRSALLRLTAEGTHRALAERDICNQGQMVGCKPGVAVDETAQQSAGRPAIDPIKRQERPTRRERGMTGVSRQLAFERSAHRVRPKPIVEIS